VGGSAHAQGLPDALIREELRLQQRERVLRQKAEPDPNVQLDAAAKPGVQRIPVEAPCFRIDRVEWAGLEAIGEGSAIDRALAGASAEDPPWGLCIGARGFNLLAERAQDFLISRGYVTTRVLVPPQDVAGGVLRLTVMPGRIRQVRAAEGQSGLPSVQPLEPGEILNLRAMEQALENGKRVPTAIVEFRIEPSADASLGPGWSDVIVSWSQPRRWRASVTADDSGTQATGKYQGSATLSLDNPLGLNDLFYATASRDLGGADAAGPRGTRAGTVHYSLPRGWWLFSLTASTSRFHQQVAGASLRYVYSGTSASGEVRAGYMLHRDASGKTGVYARGFIRAATNHIDDTEIELQRRRVAGWEVGANHRASLHAATVDLALGWRRGTGALGSLPAPEEASGEGTSRFSLVTADAALAVPFRAIDVNWRAASQWRVQWNRTPLTPQDRFSIGGRYTVRGFDGEQTLLAERGVLARNELATAFGASGHEGFVWLDHGQVSGPAADRLLGRSLTGAGVGLRGGVRTRHGAMQYELFLGGPVRKPEGFRTPRTTGGFSLGWSY
jgi:hemolysin activation/secretion protein